MLAIAMMVFVAGVGSLAIVRTQSRGASDSLDADDARLCALAGIEVAKHWINSDPNWRQVVVSGTWASQRPLGNGTFTIEGIDPLDGNLTNNEIDALLLRSTGAKGPARHIVEVWLEPAGPALEALRCALHTGGQLQVQANKQLRAGGATVFTSGSLRNLGTITANVEAGSSSSNGTINGTLTLGVAPMKMPDPDLPELYAKLGTTINPGNSIDRQVLTPGRNPWGQTNPEGIYVIRSSGDVTIKNSRIHGTLVIINPGRKVIIDDRVLIQPYRAEYPSLIITGSAELRYASASVSLSESNNGTNYNPAGAPYLGGPTDSDQSDTYPSEIHGLVHVRGSVSLNGPGRIRGMLFSESTASTNAVECSDIFEIVHDASLTTSPPMGYADKGRMIVIPGTWKQTVQ